MIFQEKFLYLMNAEISDKILYKCLDHSCHLLYKYFSCLIFTTSFLFHLTIATFLQEEVEVKESSHICQTQNLKLLWGILSPLRILHT